MNFANWEKVIDIIAQQAKLSRALAAKIYEMDMGPILRLPRKQLI
jgi:hypothetical protein